MCLRLTYLFSGLLIETPKGKWKDVRAFGWGEESLGVCVGVNLGYIDQVGESTLVPVSCQTVFFQLVLLVP